MSSLNGIQLLEVVGNVDDALVAESLAFFCPVVEGEAPAVAPVRRRIHPALRALAAAGVAAALLCGVVTFTPYLGGPDLWGGFYGVIAPLLAPDETNPEESDTVTPEEDTVREERETQRPSVDQDDPFGNGGIVQNPSEIPKPTIPSVPDPSPEWPTIQWDPTPGVQTPTVPRPNVPTPGPSPWP